MKIKILTDSAADFTPEELKKYEVGLIRQEVTFDGDEESVSSPEEFWQKLTQGGTARTAQPSREIFREQFESAREKGEAVICVLIASVLSATYENAMSVRAEVGYENVYVIDSRQAAVAEKVLVLEACRLRDGGEDAAAIVKHLENFSERIRLYACVDTLKYLVRGGRLSRTAGNIGTLVNVKPIITIGNGGTLKVCLKTIGTSSAIAHMIKLVRKDDIDDSYEIIPIYAHTDENCAAFVKKMSVYKKCAPPMQIGSTIGSHIGPGAFGIVYVLKQPNK